jgi:hypothetical protein
MPKQHKLDVDYGEDLLAYIKVTAAARGIPAAVLAKELARDARLRDAGISDMVAAAVLNLAAAIEPDERFDPAEDTRESEAFTLLASLLGSAPAAQGITRALNELWLRWVLERRNV